MARLDKVSQAAVNALEDVKARDIVVFDVKKMTAYFDKVIIATGDSNRHCRALANRVQEMVKAAGGHISGVEGEAAGEWLLVDIGSALVHIMQPAIRRYYNIEELWAPAPKPAKKPKTSGASVTARSANPAGPAAKRKPAALPGQKKPAARSSPRAATRSKRAKAA